MAQRGNQIHQFRLRRDLLHVQSLQPQRLQDRSAIPQFHLFAQRRNIVTSQFPNETAAQPRSEKVNRYLRCFPLGDHRIRQQGYLKFSRSRFEAEHHVPVVAVASKRAGECFEEADLSAQPLQVNLNSQEVCGLLQKLDNQKDPVSIYWQMHVQYQSHRSAAASQRNASVFSRAFRKNSDR